MKFGVCRVLIINMGAGASSPRFELYNSDSTDFWSFDIEEDCVDPFQICIDHTIHSNGGNTCSKADVEKCLKKNHIDGFRFYNLVMVDDLKLIEFADRISLIEIHNPPQGDASGHHIDTYLRIFPNLTRFKISINDYTRLDNDFWCALAGQEHLEFVDISVHGILDQPVIPVEYLNGTTGDCILKILNNIKEFRFSENLWRVLLTRPEVFRTAASRKTYLTSLHTSMIDIPDLQESHLELFSLLDTLVRKTIRVVEMEHPENLTKLYKYMRENEWYPESLQLCWWPKEDPTEYCPASNIHFYSNGSIPLVKKLCKNTPRAPQVKSLSTSFDGILADQKKDLEKFLQEEGLDISTDGVRVSSY